MTGRAEAINFATHHQILNRARWRTRAVARRLLTMFVQRFVPHGRVIIGMDDTIEHRWGRRINAREIIPQPSPLQAGPFRQANGLRWLSFMVLTPLSWTSLIKDLPVLTLLAPSERANRQRGGRYKLLTDRARQGALQLCRWVARTPGDLRGRQQFCRPRTGPCYHTACNAHHPAAGGFTPVRPSPATNLPHDRAARAKRRGAAQAQDAAVRPHDMLDKDPCFCPVRPQ